MNRHFLVALLLVTACAAPAAPTRQLPANARPVLMRGDPAVGTYVSTTWGFSTSSYWIEGPDGLILIDTQFLPSAAEEFIQWAEMATGKKAKLAIVLHANPDKFNGTAVMKQHGIRVITSQQVRDLIPAVHEKRLKAFYDRYQPDYPREVTLPDSFGDKDTELTEAGVTVKLHVLGAGCSAAHVAVEYEEHLFVGDLVANDSHSWLEIGKTDEWLQRLDELRALEPSVVHPGRGASGGPGLLDEEEAYLERVIALVAAEKPHLPVEDEVLERLKTKVQEAYPGYRFAVFLNSGVPAEYARQARLASGAAQEK